MQETKRKLTQDTDDKNRSNLPPELIKLRKTYNETTPWKGHVITKIDKAAPYYFFLTRVQDIPATYSEDLTISFPELLDSSLGKIEHTLHINFMVELGWLLAQYATVGIFNPSLTILHGPESPELNISPSMNINKVSVSCPSMFGKHHTKMSIFYYNDQSIRVIISTANLLESDWANRTQGVWISPACPYMGESAPVNAGESRTLFKYDLLTYLKSYKIKELDIWLRRLQKVDMSSINVFLIASAPYSDGSGVFGINKMQRVMRGLINEETSDWPIFAQCSSIGSLGPNEQSWLTSIFFKRLEGEGAKTKNKENVKVIYPSKKNVMDSLDGILGGICLPYVSATHRKQMWIEKFFHQWKSPYRNRTCAVPHIKTYTKISPDGKQISWFLLTSANLSKAAWGAIQKTGRAHPLSYEVGVLFTPQYIIQKSVFNLRLDGYDKSDTELFPFPYDPNLTPYENGDSVFLYDVAFGNSFL